MDDNAVHCVHLCCSALQSIGVQTGAVATVVGTFAMCEHSDLCTIHCALCTLCTVQCSAVRIGVSNWGRRGWWVGARQPSSSSSKGKWTNLFGTQTISPPHPPIFCLSTKLMLQRVKISSRYSSNI